MSALSSLSVLICCAGVGAGMLSVLIPQRRTKRILAFVLGLFMLVLLINGVKAALGELDFGSLGSFEEVLPTYSDSDYLDAVVQQTTETLVKAVDELLRDQQIIAEDIRLKVNISTDGRITVDRIDIYISEKDRSRKSDVRSIIYTHLAKEPNIYVQGQEAE